MTAVAPEAVAPEAAPLESGAEIAVHVAIGEALVRQSSGRHRAQAALGVGVTVGVRGPWGIAAEVFGTTSGDQSAEISVRQFLVRPVFLGVLTFARGRSAFEVGLGPAASVTLTRWELPALENALLVEPGARARAALAIGFGAHLDVRLQAGLGWRLSGVDHDYSLGASWTF